LPIREALVFCVHSPACRFDSVHKRALSVRFHPAPTLPGLTMELPYSSLARTLIYGNCNFQCFPIENRVSRLATRLHYVFSACLTRTRALCCKKPGRLSGSALSSVGSPGPFSLAQQAPTLSVELDPLTIDQAVSEAIEKNLDLVAERFNLPIAEARLRLPLGLKERLIAILAAAAHFGRTTSAALGIG
jgi:hypothetical protein